uniref:Ribosomal protein S2 n=1 Tax=Physarum polycephalum TaxID=5791 RepID=F2Y9V1_PHYPO|nr:ribosomal protein S2 [Physarum polycephalum]
MIYHYYHKRLHLFKITYKILLAYHSPLGNIVKFWTSFHMNSFILAIRNDIHILNITYTIIQIRKALNTIFHKVRYRGSFTIYAQAFKALKINHGSIFSFITDWVPGLLTNYKRVTRAIRAYKLHLARTAYFLKRPQLKAIAHSYFNPIPKSSLFKRRRRTPQIPKFPAISLSILDSNVWLHECLCLRIPSIQICDNQSQFEKVTYPIISNQRSMAFSHLIVYLAAEVSNTSLFSSHLDFLSFYKNRGPKVFASTLNKSNIISSRLRSLIRYKPYGIYTRRFHKKTKSYHLVLTEKGSYRYIKIKRQRIYYRLRRSRFIKKQRKSKRKKPLILNKRTYIFNKRFFTYQIKNLINTNINLYFAHTKHYYKIIRHQLWLSIKWLKKTYNRILWQKKHRRRRVKRNIYLRRRLLFKSIIDLYKLIIISTLGLRKTLSRKRKGKRRFITMVPFKKRDIKSLLICSYLQVKQSNKI